MARAETLSVEKYIKYIFIPLMTLEDKSQKEFLILVLGDLSQHAFFLSYPDT